MSAYVIPILVAAVAAWMFGAAYYGLLGRRWMAALGWDQAMCDKVAGGPKTDPTPFILSFIAELAMAAVLAGVLAHMKLAGLGNGLLVGGLIWAGFVLTTIAVNNAYAMRSLALTIIDALHWLGVLLIQGAVIGWWIAR